MAEETDIQRLQHQVDLIDAQVDKLQEKSYAAAAHNEVMEERVGTLIKFVDRLATVVYTSAGGLFITIVGSAILTRGA